VQKGDRRDLCTLSSAQHLVCCYFYFRTRERGCKAYIYLVASAVGNALVVHSLSNEHNHDIVPV